MFTNKRDQELALISLLISNKEAYKMFNDKIGEDLFDYNENRTMFKYIQKTNALNQEFNYNIYEKLGKEYKDNIDNITIEVNKEKDKYKIINDLTNILIETLNKSKLKEECNAIANKINNNDVIDTNNICNILYNFNEKKSNGEAFSGDFADNLLNYYDAEDVENDYKFKGGMNGTFEGGMNKGEVMYVAGASGMFKTSFLINIILDQVLNDKSCVFFSLEMPKKQIYDNIYSVLFNEKFATIKQNKSLNEDKIKLMYKIQQNLIVIDYSDIHVKQIHKTIKQIKLNKHIDFVYVDHLNILNYGKLDEYSGINEATKNFKVIEKDEELCCVVLTQLNRDAKTRKDKRPLLSDLRGSNAIAQDADFVYMLHREEYYYVMIGAKEQCPDLLKNRLEGWFAKCRRGESTKQYYEINLNTKKVLRELGYREYIDGTMIDEIEEYEECLANNDSVEVVKEKNKEEKKLNFNKNNANVIPFKWNGINGVGK